MCGCNEPYTHRAASAATPPALLADGVELAYLGARALLIAGPLSGVGYACYPGDTIRVLRQDADELVASGAFDWV